MPEVVGLCLSPPDIQGTGGLPGGFVRLGGGGLRGDYPSGLCPWMEQAVEYLLFRHLKVGGTAVIVRQFLPYIQGGQLLRRKGGEQLGKGVVPHRGVGTLHRKDQDPHRPLTPSTHRKKPRLLSRSLRQRTLHSLRLYHMIPHFALIVNKRTGKSIIYRWG